MTLGNSLITFGNRRVPNSGSQTVQFFPSRQRKIQQIFIRFTAQEVTFLMSNHRTEKIKLYSRSYFYSAIFSDRKFQNLIKNNPV